MKLKALVELRYAGVNLLPGDVFDAPENDAKILKAIKKAEDFQEAEVVHQELPKEPPKEAPKKYRTRQLKAE